MERTIVEAQPKTPKYTEYYPNDYYLLEKFSNAPFLSLEVPFTYLCGRQTIDEYPQKKQNNIKKAYKRYGEEVLERDPIIVCAVPVANGFLLVILDGHNRTRYAPQVKISKIRCYVYDISTVANIFEKTIEDTKKELLSQVNEARHSFIRKFEGRYRGFGYAIEGITSLDELEALNIISPFNDQIGRFAKK